MKCFSLLHPFNSAEKRRWKDKDRTNPITATFINIVIERSRVRTLYTFFRRAAGCSVDQEVIVDTCAHENVLLWERNTPSKFSCTETLRQTIEYDKSQRYLKAMWTFRCHFWGTVQLVTQHAVLHAYGRSWRQGVRRVQRFGSRGPDDRSDPIRKPYKSHKWL